MASSAMELQLGYSGFADHRHAKTNANKMRPRSSLTVPHFMRVFIIRMLRSQITLDAGVIRSYSHLTNHDYFDQKEKFEHPNWSPMLGLRKWRRFLDLRSKSMVATLNIIPWSTSRIRIEATSQCIFASVLTAGLFIVMCTFSC